MNKNLLIYFPYFSIEIFFRSRRREEWAVISISDFLKKGVLGMIRTIRSRKYAEFAIARPNFRTREGLYYLKGIAILAKAKEKYFADNFRKERLGVLRFVLMDSPLMLLEMFLNFFIIIFSHIALSFYSILFWLKRNRKFTKNRNKKIAFIRTDNYREVSTGGSFTHVGGFCNGVLANNWSLFFIAPNSPTNLADKTHFYKIPFPRFFNDPETCVIYYGFRLINKAYKILKKEKPAFIYQRYSAFNFSGAILAHALNIPFILEYNGSEVWRKAKWVTLYLKRLCSRFEKIALTGADKIAVVSDVLKEELLERGIKAEKIIVNPNGVDPEQFRPDIDGAHIRKKYNLGNKTVVGFIGSFGPWHGIDVLARAIKPTLAHNPSLHFLLIGDGELYPYVEKIIRADNVENFVTLTGTIPHEESPNSLAACDILVSPHVPNVDGTRFFGSPTKLFEYMAMGKPIAASNLEQIGQVLEHEKTALLVTPGNTHELTKTILRLSNDAALREELGKAAREKVTEEYTWDKNAKRVLDAYEKLTSNT